MPARVHPAWMGWDGIDCGYWCMDGGALKSAPGFGFVILDEDPHNAFQPNKPSDENLLCQKLLSVPGMLTPRKNGLPRPTRKNQALPRPAEIDKTRGAHRGKADCTLHRLSPHIWGKANYLVLCTSCDYLVYRKTI